MAVYPQQLTPEEKSLKKRYARLQEKRKQLRKAQEKPSPSSTSKQARKEAVNPKDAKEAAKRLLESGKLTIKTKPTPKRTGFKRVGELPGEAPPSKRPNAQQPAQPNIPPKPQIRASDVKELYNRTFVRASNPDALTERIPRKLEDPEIPQKSEQFTTQECTICVKCTGASEEALQVAFSRFGEIRAISHDSTKWKAFITFVSPSVANKAGEEMNEGMIRGSDVAVGPATRENGYIELPPEAANDPWALIAAGKEDALRKPETKRQRQAVTYEQEF